MTTQSPGKERKRPQPKSLLSPGVLWLSLLPVPGLGASAPVQGTTGSKGSKVLFAIPVEMAAFPLAEAQRGLSFPDPKSQPLNRQKFGIPFILEVKLHRSSLAADFSHFTELQPLPFMSRRAEPGQHPEREGKPLFPPLPGAPVPSAPFLARSVPSARGTNTGFIFTWFPKCKKPHILALFCVRGILQSRILVGMGPLLQDPVGTQCSPGRIWGAGNGKIPKFCEPRGLSPSPAAWLSSHSALPGLLIHL